MGCRLAPRLGELLQAGQDGPQVHAGCIEETMGTAQMLKKVKGRCSTTWPRRKRYKAHRVYWSGSIGICLNCGKGFLKRS